MMEQYIEWYRQNNVNYEQISVSNTTLSTKKDTLMFNVYIPFVTGFEVAYRYLLDVFVSMLFCLCYQLISPTPSAAYMRQWIE